jgi:signal transduction histidine kinase
VLTVRRLDRTSMDLGAHGRWQLRTSVKRSDGSSFPIEITRSVFLGRKGTVRGAVFLLRDLTLHKQVDAAARRIAKLEELTEVARGIAHEVRNPLASMCGCAEELAREAGEARDTRRLTDILVREAKRVDSIIDDFLSFARIRKVRRTTVDVGELIAQVGVLLRARVTGPDRHVSVEKPATPITISGDRDLLTQLLLNVGINALEALEPRGGEVRLSAEPKHSPFASEDVEEGAERGVEITVTDTGCGIADGEETKIFNPFFSHKVRGTGLGLTIAHRIARIHGGTITVSSAPGEGSTFRIWLSGASVAERLPAYSEASWA